MTKQSPLLRNVGIQSDRILPQTNNDEIFSNILKPF